MVKTKKLKIGIIGVGFVGGALLKFFCSKKIKPLVYDKFKNQGSVAQANLADVIFICVPTPYTKKGFDLSAVESAVKILKSPKIVVIKSSVIPGTTQALQIKFPRHKFIFNPEFLREAHAYADLVRPDRQILGVTKNSRAVAGRVMSVLPKSPYSKIMSSQEAEAVKYMANAFLALKVVFANEFYDICRTLEIDYRAVKQAVVKDVRIGDSHFDIKDDGYRGYGGSCFPKDVNAIIELARAKKLKTPLLLAMRQANRQYLKASGLDEFHFLSGKHKRKKL